MSSLNVCKIWYRYILDDLVFLAQSTPCWGQLIGKLIKNRSDLVNYIIRTCPSQLVVFDILAGMQCHQVMHLVYFYSIKQPIDQTPWFMLNFMDNPLHDFMLPPEWKGLYDGMNTVYPSDIFVWKQFIPLISDDNSEIDLCHSQNIKKWHFMLYVEWIKLIRHRFRLYKDVFLLVSSGGY